MKREKLPSNSPSNSKTRVVGFRACTTPYTEDIQSVASISAGNNEEIGLMIAQAIEKVGADGVLSIENGTVRGGANWGPYLESTTRFRV